MRPKLEADLKQQQAQRKFAEAAEAFSNAVYEQSESLKPVAEKFKLSIHKVENVTREPAPGAQGPLANKRFLEALFSADSLENKRNTDAVELAPSNLVAGRVLSYAPAHTQSMDEVGEKLKQLYVAHQSAELAKQEGKAKMAEWKAKPEAAQLPAAVEVGRDQARDLPREVLDAALRAPTNALPAWEGVDLGNAGYAVIKVNRIAQRPAQDAQVLEQQKAQFTQWSSMAEVMAYYEQLKKTFKVQIKVPRPQ
jgi:peptidyl-prolyl cis-trans isomerase D